MKKKKGHCSCGKAENKIFSNNIPPKKKHLLHKSTSAIITGKPKYNTMFNEQNLAEDNVSKAVLLNFVNVGPVL